MAIIVGSVAVEIVPSARGFNEKVKAKVRGLPPVEVPVDPDTKGFREKVKAKTKDTPPVEVPVEPTLDSKGQARLEAVRKRIEEVTRRAATATIKVDDTKGQEKLNRLDRDLLAIGRRVAKPKVNIDGLARSEVELRALELQLDKLGKTDVNPDKNGSAAKSVAGLTGGFSLLGLAVAALGPALIPAAAGLTALVGGLAVPLAAATAGVGAFAAFAIPAFKSVTDASTKMAKAQAAVNNAITSRAHQTALIRQQQLLASLDPAIRTAVASLNQLKATYHSLSVSLRPALFGVFNAGLQVANAALPLLASVARAVAPALTAMGNVLAYALSTPGVRQFVAFISAQAGPAIMSFGVILLNLAEGFGRLMMAFAPVGSSMLEGLINLSAAFAVMTQSTGFREFLAYAVAMLPLVGRLFLDLVHTVGLLLVALAPLGALVLRGLDLLIVGIGWLTRQVPILVPAVLALVAAFMLAGPAAAAFAFLASPIGLVAAGVALLALGFVALYKHSAPLRELMHNIGMVFRDLAEKALPILRRIFALAMEGVRAGIKIAADAIAAHRPQFDQLVRAFRTVADFVVTRLLPVLGPILKGVFIGIGFAIGLVIDGIALGIRAFVDIKNAVTGTVHAFETAVVTIGRWGSIVGRDVAGAALAVGRFFTRIGHDIKAAFDVALRFVVRFGLDLLRILVGAVLVLSAPFRAAFGFVWRIVSAVFLLAHDIVARAFGQIRGLFDRFVQGSRIVWAWLWDHVKGYVLPAVNFVRTVVTTAFNAVVAAFTWVRTRAVAIWNALYGAVRTAVVAAFNAVRGYISSAAGWIAGRFSAIRSTVTGIWSGLWGTVKRLASDVWGGVKSGISSALDAIKTAFSRGVGFIRDIWNGLKAIAEAPVKFIVNTVYTGGIKRLFDDVAKAVGSKARLPGIALPFATGGVIPGPVSPVDNTLIWARSGEGVLVPGAVSALGGERGIGALNRAYGGGQPPGPGFAGGGIVGAVGSALGAAGGIGSHLLDILKDPLGAFRHLAAGALGLMDRLGQSPLAQIGVGSVHKLVDVLGSSLRSAVASFAGGGGGGGTPIGGAVGGGAARWSSMVLQILAMMGQSPALLAGVLRRINFESGGNPNAINLSDSNARAGHPSQGLGQTIPSTFNAYAGAFRGLGITNPFANIWASLHYALARYGSIAAIDPLVRPRGYAGGGVITEPIWGVGRSGQTYTFGERGREYVTPAAKVSGGGDTYHFNMRSIDLTERNLAQVQHTAALRARVGRPR
jgi:SLT domain-containing protein/phage-related protein